MATLSMATLSALSEPVRIEILDRVSAGSEVTVTQLAAVMPLTRQGIARHVKTLEDAGLLVGEKDGREHRYRVSLNSVQDARQWLGARAASWDSALQRLADFLEST